VRKILKRWRWFVAGLGVLIVGGLVTGWLLFQHIPSWYQPMRIAPGDVQRVIDDMTRTYDTLSVALNETHGPFKFRLTQDQLNAWLTAREGVDPATRDWLPPALSDPMVLLEPDGTRLGATYNSGSLHAVVSAKLAVSADGQGVTARLKDISGGSLSLPGMVIRKGLRAFDKRIAPKLEEAGVSAPGRQRIRLNDLLDGVVLPNVAKLPPEGQRFRVIDIRFEPGAVVLTLERIRRGE
jgi:hypothetical protein